MLMLLDFFDYMSKFHTDAGSEAAWYPVISCAGVGEIGLVEQVVHIDPDGAVLVDAPASHQVVGGITALPPVIVCTIFFDISNIASSGGLPVGSTTYGELAVVAKVVAAE